MPKYIRTVAKEVLGELKGKGHYDKDVGSGWASRIGFKNFLQTRSSDHLSKSQQNLIQDACPQS